MIHILAFPYLLNIVEFRQSEKINITTQPPFTVLKETFNNKNYVNNRYHIEPVF